MGWVAKMSMADIVIISVIMLTYNREAFVPRAIESILGQTFTDFEYIIVDNGSTDRSGIIADEYAAKDSRIRVIHRSRGNIGSGRNVGLDAAKGQYVAFVDDDDLAEPDMLAFLYALCKRYYADISFCGSMKEVSGDIVPNCVFEGQRLFTPDEAVYELLERKKLNAATPTKLFHRSLFKQLRFSETGKYDDISLVYKLFATADRVAGHGIPKYCFCRHAGNNSGFTGADAMLTPTQLEEYFAVYRERTAWLCERLPAIADYVRYSEWSFYISMLNKIVLAGLSVKLKDQMNYLRAALTRHFDVFYQSAYLKDFEQNNLERYFGAR